MKTHIRELQTLTSGIATSDGDGVKMTRIIGSPELNMLDPFLLFDAFESEQANDYIGGFPDHPHRGFETVTYLLAGRMRHKDSAGHEGVIETGGVQWMTAGKGIIHSEMPEQEEGLLQGFQLWINLPAKQKMQAPAYQEFTAAEIAVERLANGTEIRVIAGTTNQGTTGPVMNHWLNPLYMDVTLPKNQIFEQTVNSEANVFIYLIDGELMVGEAMRVIGRRKMGVLREGEQVRAKANKTTRFLLLAAQPLNEPVARGGPFVMNTKAEVLQAFDDFKHNTFL
ncbi:MAG: pirin family protein [Methyloprofundus sp.]|nr:pirin family protein [Methyloprofundus sp.]MDT8424553.1 pirin family protein [Methyloprofundus sp.]